MTARINRNTPLVEPNTGVPTLYGWSVLQSIWRATGGEQTVDGTEMKVSVLHIERDAEGGDVEPAPTPMVPGMSGTEPVPLSTTPDYVHNLTVTGALAHEGDTATFAGEIEHTGGMAGFFGASPVAQQTAPESLTDSTGGTTDNTVAMVGDTSTTNQAGVINDNFAEVVEELNRIRTVLTNLGLAS